MTAMRRDPLDVGEPGVKEWEEFRSSYAAAFVLVWLVEELQDELADYARDLQNRFMSGWDLQDTLDFDADVSEDEKAFPLPPVGNVSREDFESDLVWMDNSEAHALYDQLFPHRDSARDFPALAMQMATVALHGALEAYARASGVHGTPLPRTIEDHLVERDASHLLDSVTMRALVECVATRNFIAHNRGIVDDRYRRAVQDPGFERGEFRIVTPAELHAFSKAIWKTAAAIRIARASGAV